jgi:hypothetical protein
MNGTDYYTGIWVKLDPYKHPWNPEVLLTSSEQLDTGPYPKPDESSPLL